MHPQTSPDETQSKVARKRTAAERQRKDGHSRACRWAGITVRSREGKLIRDVRTDLFRHVGGKPSVTQRMLIERATMLTVQIARMDAKALEQGAMSDHASREYLAWSNTLRRTLSALGMKAAPETPRTLAEIQAEYAARTAA